MSKKSKQPKKNGGHDGFVWSSFHILTRHLTKPDGEIWIGAGTLLRYDRGLFYPLRGSWNDAGALTGLEYGKALALGAKDKMKRKLHRMTLQELKGRHVRLLREIRNKGGDIFPAGSEMEIVDKYGGLGLRWPDAERTYAAIRRVSYDAVMLIEPGKDAAGKDRKG